MKKKLYWDQGEKALFAVSGGLILLFLFGGLWWQWANAVPGVTVPTPTLPDPNAHDLYVAATGAMVNRDEVGDAVSAVPGRPGPGGRTFTRAERQALVQANAEALRRLRAGFAHPYHAPPLRSFDAVLPHLAGFRAMARLLALEGNVAAERGDWNRAAGSYLDALRLGADTARGGTMIDRLVAVALQAIGRRPLWKAADHLDGPDARAAARRMEAITARSVPFADTLREEKWLAQASLVTLFRRNDVTGVAREFVRWADMGEEGPDAARVAAMQARLLLRGKRRILNDYTAFMDASIEAVGAPYAARRPLPAVPDDPVNELLIPVIEQARFGAVETDMQNALLTAKLALRAYRLERGAYPRSLAELVPGYLTKIPADPFALDAPLRYRRAGAKYVLYSVGPDGKDDGGRPIRNPDTQGREKRYAEAASRGDFVVGVNAY